MQANEKLQWLREQALAALVYAEELVKDLEDSAEMSQWRELTRDHMLWYMKCLQVLNLVTI